MTENQHSHSNFVTHDDCERQVKSYKWLIGVATGIISVLLALVVYSANLSYGANAKYETLVESVTNVREKTSHDISMLEALVGKQTVIQQSIIQQLSDMKGEMVSQRQEQKLLLEKILSLQIEIARSSGIQPHKQQ
jgi:succinate dehydrogenase hydrophobic anchor subunit